MWSLFFLFRNELFYCMFLEDLAHIHISLGKYCVYISVLNNFFKAHLLLAYSTYLLDHGLMLFLSLSCV